MAKLSANILSVLILAAKTDFCSTYSRWTAVLSTFGGTLSALLSIANAQSSTANPKSSIANPVLGSAALAAAAAAAAAAIAAKRRRKEEEEAQARAVRAEAETKNAALRTQEAQKRKQAKIQNYLNGKAMLEAALQNSPLSEAERQAVQEQARSKGIAAALGLLAAVTEAAQKTQQMQNAIATNKNLSAAETEMDKVKPVTPYVASAYIDKDEAKWLKGQENQRAWAAVHAQEQAKPWWQRVAESVSAFAQTEVEKFKTWNTIRNEYGWTPIGNFSQKELTYIADSGSNIETKIDAINGGRGSAWMDRYMSNVLIMKWPSFLKMDQPWTLPLPKILSPLGKSIILLPKNWEKSYEKVYEKDPKIMLLNHEFGHVWDIATGHIDFRAEINNLLNNRPITGIVNGLADELNTFIGGDIVQLNSTRMTAGTGIDHIPHRYRWTNNFNDNYGNNSIADYFAEGFNALINDPSKIPTPDVKQWSMDVINNETSRLP